MTSSAAILDYEAADAKFRWTKKKDAADLRVRTGLEQVRINAQSLVWAEQKGASPQELAILGKVFRISLLAFHRKLAEVSI